MKRLGDAWPLALVLVAAPLAIGGTRPAVQVALAALAAAMAAVALRSAPRPVWSRWMWPPVVLVGLGILQCIPLPPTIWQSVSPLSVGLRDGWAPLTLDRPATVIATLHQAAFALVLVTAAHAGRRARRRLLRVLTGVAAAVAALGLVHWAIGAERIFGVVGAHDRAALGGYFSVFVNPNTLAGFLVLGAAVAWGRATATTDAAAGRRATAMALLAAGGVVLSGSRGGVVALGLAALVFGGLALRRAPVGTEGRRHRRRALAGIIAAVAGFAASLLALTDWGADPWLDGRLIPWRESVPLVLEHWIAGVGRGAFQYAFPLVQQTPIDGTVTHPETIGLQLVTEWGLLGGTLAVLGGVGAWCAALRRDLDAPDPRSWGLLAGLAAVGAHQLVDFGLEAMGLSLPVAVALGLALGGRTATRPRRVTRGIVSAATLTVLSAGAAGVWAVVHHADADADRLQTTRGLAAATDAAMARHPADGQQPLVAAHRLARVGAPLPAVMHRLNQAMRRLPADGRPHLLAARFLRATGHEAQAAGEYRLAIEKTPWRALPLIGEVATLRGPLVLATAVPAEDEACRRLGEALLAADRAEDARRTMEAILLLDPARVPAHRMRGRACLATGDAACVETEARWLGERNHPGAHALRARAALNAGDPVVAEAHAAALLDVTPDDPGALWLAAEVVTRTGDIDAVRARYDRLYRRVGGRPVEAAAVLRAWSRVEARIGDPERAKRLSESADRLAP